MAARGLENFKVSQTITGIIEVATLYTRSGILGAEEFFRGAVLLRANLGIDRGCLPLRTLNSAFGSDAINSAYPPPRRRAASSDRSAEVSPELLEAFQDSASVRKRTGGKDNFLGLRHILFSLVTLPSTVPQLNLLLRPIRIDAAWLASQLTKFLQEALEPGERWEDWLELIRERSGEGATSQTRSEAAAAIPFNIDQTSLSDAASYMLTSAAERGTSKSALSTSMVLVELIERGRARGGAYWSADFLWQETNPFAAKYAEMRKEYLSREGQSPAKSFPNMVTPGLAYVLAHAQDLAEQTSSDSTIFARHLLAAIISEPPTPHRLGSVKRLEELGVDILLLREHFFEWLKGYGDNDDAWRVLLLGSKNAPQRLTEFDADDTRGPDLLDVKRDVRALATLIAARSLAPPLSVGLFGDWGTGKTFFMRQLQAMVAQLSKEARDSGEPQRQVPFYKHVVQIEFNAWHYVEGNLWASLVDHIFRNLRQTDRSTRESVEAMQKHWIEQLGFKETVLSQAQERISVAASQITTANQKVRDLKEEQRVKTEKLQRLTAKNVARDFHLSGMAKIVADALQPLGLEAASDAASDLDSSLRQARNILGRGSSLLTPLFRSADRTARWRSLVIILFSGPAAVLLVNLIFKKLGKDAISQIYSFLTWATTTMTLAAAWIRKQGAWVAARLDEVEKANRSYDAALSSEQAETAKKIAQTEQELALAHQEYAAAQQAAEQARREHEALRKELAEVTPGRLLGKFIEDRAASSDYRKHLGVLAVIRDDFQEMSKLIEQEKRTPIEK
jgi:hypothetical protein